MPRTITDKDCQPRKKFRSAEPIFEYCRSWRKASTMQLSSVDRAELEGAKLNPSKVRCNDLEPNQLVRMRTRLHTLSGV